MEKEKRTGFSEEQKDKLLKLGIRAIEQHIQTGNPIELHSKDPVLVRKAAVFVTLRIGNQLRGCVGQINAEYPLLTAIQKAAVSAAFEDPRFQPVCSEEIPYLRLKIAILSPMKHIEVEDVEVGKHGLLIMDQGQRGLLLPEVASDRGWDKTTYLENLCIKAGLPEDAWKNADLFGFTTEVIE